MFQIQPLCAVEFSHLNGLGDDDLGKENIQVHVSDGTFPCRVTLSDVPAGERVFLLNYEHQPEETPYRSRHAIFVQENAEENWPETGDVPLSIQRRLLSVRAFDEKHEIIEAEIVEGADVANTLEGLFEKDAVNYVHLHFATRGCFAAKVIRAAE